MKKAVKYVSILAASIGILIVGVVALKKYADNYLPSYGEDDWL